MADRNRITRKRRSSSKSHVIKPTQVFDLTDSGDAGVRLIAKRRVSGAADSSPAFKLKQERNKSPWKEDKSTRKVRPDSDKSNTADPTAQLRKFIDSITRK